VADDVLVRSVERLCDLQNGTLHRDTTLKSIEQWDSLRIVEFVALADSEYGVVLDYDRLSGCQTVGELVALVEEQRRAKS